MDLKQLMVEAIEGTIKVHKYAIRNGIEYTVAKSRLHNGDCFLCILDSTVTSLLLKETKNANCYHCLWIRFYRCRCRSEFYAQSDTAITRLEEWKYRVENGELNMYFYSIDRED